jgi:hypothetical protein
MDSVLYSEETDEWGISPTRGYIIPYIIMDPYLIEYEYIIEGLSLEELTRDRYARRRHDRHISIEHRLDQYITLYAQWYFDDISTYSIRLTMDDTRVLHLPLIMRISRVFDDEILAGHGRR